MRLSVLASCLLALLLATAAEARSDETGRPAAALVRDGDRWTLTLELNRDAPVWAFVHSAQMQDGRPQWRPEQWTVLTSKVALDRVGEHDVIRSTDGGPVPRRVSLRLAPASAAVQASYNPALVFSDGAVALFSGQFDVFPLASLSAVQELPGDLNGLDLGVEPTHVQWRDTGGLLLFQGRRVPEAVAADAQTYVLFGQAGVTEHASLATVIDPGLPAWIADSLVRFSPDVIGYYADRLDGGPEMRPTIMAAWAGATPGMTSMGGSVLPGLVVVRFEGEGVTESSEAMDAGVRWFIAHEAAHFWLGQTVRYEFARDMWITEGGADLMAVRAVAALTPGYDARAVLQESVDDCVALSVRGSVASAAERGEHRAFYACGAVFAMAAEGAVRRRGGRDVFDFLAPLIAANREDGVLTRAEWLAELDRVSQDDAQSSAIVGLLDIGAADPAAEVEGLLSRAGVSVRRERGRVILAD